MSEQSITLSLVQYLPEETIQENISKALQLCKKAKGAGADLILFPEMWLIGYNMALMKQDYALERDHDVFKQFCLQARNLSIAIAITYLGVGREKPTNNVMLIDASGRIVFEYAKVHVCDFKGGTETALEAGPGFCSGSLTINGNELNVGAMICFDREFPESARELASRGAHLILVPNSCKIATCDLLGNVRLQQARSRAFENMVALAVSNYPAPKDDGNSCLIGPDGKIIALAGEGEELLVVTLNLEFLHAWRAHEVWGIK